jgi:hypothetical protein
MASSEAGPTPSPAATEKVVLDGKEYAVDELQEAIRGGLRQSDYTRKTQELARERERLEELEEELRERMASMEQPASLRALSEDEDDPWVQRFSRLESQISTVTQALSERQKAEAEEREMQGRVSAIEAELNARSMMPGFDRNEVLTTMKQYGMDRPDQVEAAYRIVAGPKIGQSLGEKLAISRGAVEPPVMGSNGLAMTAPFATPGEAAPSVDYSKLSWEQVSEMAQKDPRRPR